MFVMAMTQPVTQKKIWSKINPLPDDKFLDWSKLKAFADDKINVT